MKAKQIAAALFPKLPLFLVLSGRSRRWCRQYTRSCRVIQRSSPFFTIGDIVIGIQFAITSEICV